jgi:hypothetical protein
MATIEKGMPLDTPQLSNYRSTGESFPTGQRYTKDTFIESFLNQFNTIEQAFYSGAIVKLNKHLVR